MDNQQNDAITIGGIISCHIVNLIIISVSVIVMVLSFFPQSLSSPRVLINVNIAIVPGAYAGGPDVGLSSLWKTVCNETQPWTTLEGSLRGKTVLLPGVWKGLQAEGAHAEAPQQPPPEG